MHHSGMRVFFIIWVGQLVSLFGTGMTRFALIVWAYQQTGNATTLALMGFFGYGSAVLTGFLASAWIDRYDKRKMMLFADSGAGLTTVGLLVLFSSDNLMIWHLYLAQIIVGGMDALQFPAYSALVTALIPKQHFARASGLKSFAGYSSSVLAPFMAGFALHFIGISGILLIDMFTFLIAAATLVMVSVPVPSNQDASLEEVQPSFRENLLVGLRYIRARPGLIGLLLQGSVMNFLSAITYFAIMPALILARTGGDEIALSMVQATLGIGGVVGSLILATWGGPKRQIHGVLAGAALSFILGDLLFAVGRDVIVWVFAAFTAAVFIPFISGSNIAIWQRKVTSTIQGRVFVVQNSIRQIAMPVGFLIGGVIADYVFEPAMQSEGVLAGTFGWLVGTGDGAGMGLMFACTAFLGCLSSLGGYLYKPLRYVEDDLPDFDEPQEISLQPAAV